MTTWHMSSSKQVLSIIAWCLILTKALSENMSFSTVLKGQSSGIEEPMNKAIQSSSEFDILWESHTSISSPKDDVPAINFDTEMVLCAFRGTKNTGGYGIEITSVEDKGDEVVVSCETKDPAPGAMLTTAFSQPFHIVRTQKSSKTVRFEFVAAAPPPPPFPQFTLTFDKNHDPEVVVGTISDLDAVTNVQLLRSVKIAFVDFDPNAIDKFDAFDLLQNIDGVASVEADPPMDGSQGGGMGVMGGMGMGV